jgi:hypothetical protein
MSSYNDVKQFCTCVNKIKQTIINLFLIVAVILDGRVGLSYAISIDILLIFDCKANLLHMSPNVLNVCAVLYKIDVSF